MGYRAISNHLIINYIARAKIALKRSLPSFSASRPHSEETEGVSKCKVYSQHIYGEEPQKEPLHTWKEGSAHNSSLLMAEEGGMTAVSLSSTYCPMSCSYRRHNVEFNMRRRRWRTPDGHNKIKDVGPIV